MTKYKDYILASVGIILIVSGLILNKIFFEAEKYICTIFYVLLGVGCGMFGHYISKLISKRTLKSSPDIQKQISIEENDERNITIKHRAESKAYHSMIFIFGALLLVFALMGVEMLAILLLVISYLLIVGIAVFYYNKYSKEM